MAEIWDIKFSNDGKSMLLTTKSNNIYVLDAYNGEKVSNSISVFTYVYLCLSNFLTQRCGFSVDASPNTTIEATFTPDGQYVISGIFSFLH